MKVYLAGKMDATHGAWRDAIIPPIYHYGAKRFMPSWEIPIKIDSNYDLEDLRATPWPTTPNKTVLGLHDYVGPYRSTFVPFEPEGKHLGYFHGSAGYGQHGCEMSYEEDRSLIAGQCFEAIARCDLFFAYLNSPDCFGTLAEVGMARAFRKFVYIAVDDSASWSWDDYWFVEVLANATSRVMSLDAEDRPAIGPDFENDRIREIFKDAIVHWSAVPRPDPIVSLAPAGQGGNTVAREAAASFSQIARWSADPRVRDEARRMLRRITG